MANTTNFGWETPDDTDLVKDGAAAMRTLGNSIDASFVDLKGGTTGQVLAKASNTDLDFTWSSVDPLTILDAKGDLITATAADTPARLAVGTNGQVLTADSAESSGLKWATVAADSMTTLASGSLSGTTVTLSSISQGYKDLILVLRDFSVSNNSAQLNVGLNNQASGQIYGYTVQQYANSLGQTYTYISPWATRSILASGADNSLIVRIFDYTSTTYHNINALGTMKDTGADAVNYGFWNGSTLFTTAIDRIDIFLNSVYEFDAGTYILYGVK